MVHDWICVYPLETLQQLFSANRKSAGDHVGGVVLRFRHLVPRLQGEEPLKCVPQQSLGD